MKRFLIKFLLFLLLPVTYCGFNVYSNLSVIDQFHFTDYSETLIIGDSEMEYAVNPAVLTTKTFTMAEQAEPYYLSYWKLKRYVKDNSSLKNVLIGFSFHNLSTLNNLRLSHPRWNYRFFEKSYTVENIQDLKELPIDYNTYYKVLFLRLAAQIHDQHDLYFHEFTEDERILLPNINRAINTHFYVNEQLHGYSQVSDRYLDSIVNFCAENDLKLTLLTTPLHKKYRERVPEKFRTIYLNKCKDLLDKGIIVHNFSEFYFEDEFYLDYNHLNKKGSDIFSLMVDSVLNIPISK